MTEESKPVSYVVGVDEANMQMPVRFMRMSDGTLYRLKHHLAKDGNEIAEAATQEASVIRGAESGIVFRVLGERPYIDPAMVKAAWEAQPPPWRDEDTGQR